MSEYRPGLAEVTAGNETLISLHARVKDLGTRIELDVFKEVLAGFFEGQGWLFRKFPYPDSPALRFRSFGPRTEHMPSCCFRDVIELNVESFKLLKQGTSVDTIFKIFWGISAPPNQQLSVRQVYQAIGVHETVHFLQKNGRPGFSRDPMDESDYVPPTADLLTYWKNPREAEAIRHEGQFFQERYGSNPFLQIEQASTSPQ